MICELKTCSIEHDGKYGTGRFCSLKCARAFSTAAKRKQINEQVSKTLTISKRKDSLGKTFIDKLRSGEITREQFELACKESKTWPEVFKKLEVRKTGSSYVRARECVKKWNIDTSHFTIVKYDPWERLRSRPGEGKGKLRKWLLAIGREYKCSECGLGDMWNGKALRIQVDHINGLSWDHRPENLRFLCPNCHSQTETFCWHNVKKLKKLKMQE